MNMSYVAAPWVDLCLYRSVQLSSDLVEDASERLFSNLPFVSCVLSSKLKFALQVYYWHTPSSTLRPSNHLPWTCRGLPVHEINVVIGKCPIDSSIGLLYFIYLHRWRWEAKRTRKAKDEPVRSNVFISIYNISSLLYAFASWSSLLSNHKRDVKEYLRPCATPTRRPIYSFQTFTSSVKICPLLYSTTSWNGEVKGSNHHVDRGQGKSPKPKPVCPLPVYISVFLCPPSVVSIGASSAGSSIEV